MAPAAPPEDCILVVEDDADLRETLAAVLEEEGYAVATAANGREALRYLHECPPPCLILLDLMMPVMNGWEFRQQQQQDPQLSPVPVVVISAVANPMPPGAPPLDAAEFLTKPVDPQVLLDQVSRHCLKPGDRPKAP
jgi:CheY-like chemotaxis protein